MDQSLAGPHIKGGPTRLRLDGPGAGGDAPLSLCAGRVTFGTRPEGSSMGYMRKSVGDVRPVDFLCPKPHLLKNRGRGLRPRSTDRVGFPPCAAGAPVMGQSCGDAAGSPRHLTRMGVRVWMSCERRQRPSRQRCRSRVAQETAKTPSQLPAGQPPQLPR
jgi:hypothetical protein